MGKVILVLIFAALTFAQTPSNSGPTATVTIHVVDADGRGIANCRVSHFVRQDPLNVTKVDLDMTSHFNGLHGTDIPFGTYFYTLKRKLGDGREGSGSGLVPVFRLDVYSVLQADLGLLYGAAADGVRIPDRKGITGRLEPPLAQSDYEPVWIHLSPVYAGEQFDVAVNPAGEFRIYDAPSGLYTFTVVQAGQVLHVQPIEFTRVSKAQPLVVRMTNQSPEVISIHESVGNISEETRQ